MQRSQRYQGYPDVCPEGERPYMLSVDDTVKECAANVPGSCPGQFLCRFNLRRNKYYCCSPSAENLCPEGRALFRSRQTSQPRRCIINSLNDCTEGFSCQSQIKGVTQGFCCTEQNVCRGGAQFIVDTATKMPRICTTDLFSSCPVGYRCQLPKPHSHSGYCCKNDKSAMTEGCPPSEYVYLSENKVVECNPFNSTVTCPPGFTCQFAVLFQRYQCCGKMPSDEFELKNRQNGCFPNQVALLKDDRPVVCTASGDGCPLGYFCQFSQENQQFQCCGLESDCPGASMAYLDVTGEAMRCSTKISSCPKGFSCMQTKNQKHLCCTAATSPIVSYSQQITPEATSSLAPKNAATTPSSSTVSTSKSPPESPSCANGSAAVNGKCRNQGSLGAPCFVASQCEKDYVCANFICVERAKKTMAKTSVCPEGSIKVNGDCLEMVAVHGVCLVSAQCKNGSECVDGKLSRASPQHLSLVRMDNNQCYSRRLSSRWSVTGIGYAPPGLLARTVDAALLIVKNDQCSNLARGGIEPCSTSRRSVGNAVG
ncbi:hypothetical protein Q1695_014428 [Nippostrongylus brasiliensis]|nr:hypothetical protein Q1695_014428 [Nippostrongylus brasiliensis]